MDLSRARTFILLNFYSYRKKKSQVGKKHLPNHPVLLSYGLLFSHVSHLWLCNLADSSQPGSSVHGTSQARLLKWVAIFSSRASSQPHDISCVSFIVRQILYHWALCSCCLVAKSCSTLSQAPALWSASLLCP